MFKDISSLLHDTGSNRGGSLTNGTAGGPPSYVTPVGSSTWSLWGIAASEADDRNNSGEKNKNDER